MFCGFKYVGFTFDSGGKSYTLGVTNQNSFPNRFSRRSDRNTYNVYRYKVLSGKAVAKNQRPK